MTGHHQLGQQPDHVPDQTDVVLPGQAMAAAQLGYDGDGTPPLGSQDDRRFPGPLHLF